MNGCELMFPSFSSQNRCDPYATLQDFCIRVTFPGALICTLLRARTESGGLIMNIGSSTPLQQLTPLKECFSINDVRTLVAKQLRVDIKFVTSETHFTNDLGADLLDRVELMLAIEDKFAGVEMTDDDVEQIQVVGDLIQHLNTKIIAATRSVVKRNLVKG
jgi:acyl carrier protein